jgi:Protein of unknown function (DUF3105)
VTSKRRRSVKNAVRDRQLDPSLAARARLRKEEARRARQKARRRAEQRGFLRKSAIGALVVVAVAGGLLWLQRSTSSKPVNAAALAAGQAAGCGNIQQPEGSSPARTHLDPGQTYQYPNEPATAGPHDPSPLPPDPHIYDSPVPETQAVHNLEHAYVLIYYRESGRGALPQAVVSSLQSLANAQTKVIMAPHSALPEGTALALTGWNRLWECPATTTTDQATMVATGFIDAYRGTSNAPEPRAA